MRLIAGLVSLAAVAAVGLVAAAPSQRALVGPTPHVVATQPLIQVAARRSGGRLYGLDARSLRRVRGESMPLPSYAWGYAFSPDGRWLALGTGVGRVPALSIFDLKRWRAVGTKALPQLPGGISTIAFTARDRLVALAAGYHDWQRFVTLAVPQMRVTARSHLHALVIGVQRTRRGLVALAAPPQGSIGVARLVVARPGGVLETIPLDRIAAGQLEAVAGGDQPPLMRRRWPALAATADGNRAFVVADDGATIADVDLRTAVVTYRSASPRRSLLSRVASVVDPVAHAKEELAAGSYREAALIGNVLAVSGYDRPAPRDPSTVPPARPYGLRLIDTRSWHVRTVDRGAQGVIAVGGAFLTGVDSAGTAARRDGLAAYEPDGSLRFRRFAGRTAVRVAAAGRYAFVKLERGDVHVVDLASGRTIRVLREHVPPTVIAPQPGELDRSSARAPSAGRAWLRSRSPAPTIRARPSVSVAREHVGIRLGYTARGRPITATAAGVPDSARRLLVVGCIHGDECAGTQVVRDLATAFPGGCPPPTADVWSIANLNPDGSALGVRVNGRGVDLNRNFPAGWRASGRPWDPEYSGRAPLSERETRTIARLVARLRPTTTIWFHQQAQPLVRAWGRSMPVARRFARLARLHFVPMRWLAGTAPNWQNHLAGGGASFVVELPLGRLPATRARALARAVAQLAAGKASQAG